MTIISMEEFLKEKDIKLSEDSGGVYILSNPTNVDTLIPHGWYIILGNKLNGLLLDDDKVLLSLCVNGKVHAQVAVSSLKKISKLL